MNRNVIVKFVFLIALFNCKETRNETSPKISPEPAGGRTALAPMEIAAIKNMTPDEQRAAQLAKEALMRECALVPATRVRFVKGTVNTEEASGYLRNDFGWGPSVSITLVHQPSSDPVFNDQQFLFRFGAGRRPGMVTGKRGAKLLCNLERRASGPARDSPCNVENSDDCFLDLPALSSLDAGRPPSVVESVANKPPPPTVCFGFGFDPPQFWKCRPTVSQCNAERRKEKREEHEDYRVRTACAKTRTAHCFKTIKTICAPSAETCVRSRDAWTELNNEASSCEPASEELLAAAKADDEE